MEDLLADDRPTDFCDNDFQYILDTGVFKNVPLAEQLEGLHSNNISDLLDDPLLSDRLPYDDDYYGDSLSPTPYIQSDHSYSMANEIDSPFFKTIKVEPDEDYENEFIDILPLSPELHQPIPLLKKEKEKLPYNNIKAQQVVLKEPLYPHLKPKGSQRAVVLSPGTKHNVPHLKVELLPSPDESGSDNVDLPPTPPSSTPSDSEGGSSPQRRSPSEPSSPVGYESPVRKPESRTTAITSQMFTNLQRLPPSGPIVLTEEEKRTLVAEGYPIPTKLPLTKAEEKALKKVRRKIKNKISAQESRRKKKEYVEALEKRMESYSHENGELRKKVENLETTNESLAEQLERLQAIVNKVTRPIKASATQTGTCLMVLVLCFAVFLGSWSPHSPIINSSRSTLFRPSSAPSTSPNSFPYGPNDPHHYEHSMGENVGPVFGPEEDPYATPSRLSSRILMSFDEAEDCSNTLDAYVNYQDDDPPPPYKVVSFPESPNPVGMSASVVRSEDGGSNLHLQATIHPDIQLEMPVDTLASINRSSNK
ncbi:cyclic AMP-responsive element-binding protein 3-like protein 2 [Apostichopus japonicus]|uniref:cyclic AMP-responsive element-binding protein 3-like protein 2 n=1 Tax=Stichopus japonicus TaxID=307972 RepID=UPI003AB3715A